MATRIRKLADKSARAVKKALKNAETRALAAEGRRSVQGKVRTVKKVTRKAVKTGLITGALAAASVVVREVRKRRKLS
jgi:hypothetical protein